MDTYGKKYKEALEKARQLCAYPTTKPFISDLQDLFPELKESEDEDERIRKELIGFLRNIPNSNYTCEEMALWLEKQGEKTADKIEPFDKYDGLTDFERTLADICIGWIGEELGWQQYIKDNADVLLKIAIKKFNSVQDTLFKQKPAWSEEDEKNLQGIIDEIQANKSSAPSYDINVYDRFLSWLKQLKQRVGG